MSDLNLRTMLFEKSLEHVWYVELTRNGSGQAEKVWQIVSDTNLGCSQCTQLDSLGFCSKCLMAVDSELVASLILSTLTAYEDLQTVTSSGPNACAKIKLSR
jgi:hypothetical protein